MTTTERPACRRYTEISKDGLSRMVYVSYPLKDGIYKERKQYKLIPDVNIPIVIKPRKPRDLKPDHLRRPFVKSVHDPKYNDISSSVRRCFRQDFIKLAKFNLLTKDEQDKLVNLVLEGIP